MQTPIDLDAGEMPFGAPGAPEAEDWLEGDAHQEINDRRARLESAETLRLVRAL